MMRIFDALFVNQLLRTNEGGETVFYPNGTSGRGYRVPPEREPVVRSGLRRMALGALIGASAIIILSRLVERWLGYEVPLPWLIGGLVVAFIVIFVAIIRYLARLTTGLEPMSQG